jgi:thymidylate synthase (FAD)
MVELVSEVGVELITAAASDDMVAKAAWVSFDQDKEERLKDRAGIAKLINFLYRNKHMSPFEHGHFTFKVDVPLFVAREFHRHRTASYNEVSGRYTEMKPRFWVGEEARVQKGKPGDYFFESADNEQTALYLKSKEKAARASWELYQDRLQAGIAKEQAREDLPLSLMTQFYVTMNPRNLMQFLTLRNESHALAEIQAVAVKMEEIFAEHMPLTYEAYRATRDEERVDVEALEKKITELSNQVEYLRKDNNAFRQNVRELEAQVSELDRKAKEAERVRDEAVEKYNGLYVTLQEKDDTAQKETIWGDHTDRVDTGKMNGGKIKFSDKAFEGIINNGIDYIVPRTARLAENAAPVYNIYLDVKNGGDPKEIAAKVMETLKRMERRKGQR